jgi:hypothetical protein
MGDPIPWICPTTPVHCGKAAETIRSLYPPVLPKQVSPVSSEHGCHTTAAAYPYKTSLIRRKRKQVKIQKNQLPLDGTLLFGHAAAPKVPRPVFNGLWKSFVRLENSALMPKSKLRCAGMCTFYHKRRFVTDEYLL